MRSVKTSLVLEVSQKVERVPGVWEWGKPVFVAVKATQEGIFESRLDRAAVDGLVLNGRFSMRYDPALIEDDDLKIEYARWRGNRYKILRTTPALRDHKTTIELGEMV
jgi:hypothetical protein